MLLPRHLRTPMTSAWPWPKSACVIPVGKDTTEYAKEVYEELYAAKIFADVDLSSKTLNKKVREGQLAQYNLIPASTRCGSKGAGVKAGEYPQ